MVAVGSALDVSAYQLGDKQKAVLTTDIAGASLHRRTLLIVAGGCTTQAACCMTNKVANSSGHMFLFWANDSLPRQRKVEVTNLISNLSRTGDIAVWPPSKCSDASPYADLSFCMHLDHCVCRSWYTVYSRTHHTTLSVPQTCCPPNDWRKKAGGQPI